MNQPTTPNTVEEIRELLAEAYSFKSTSPKAQENINAALDLLDGLVNPPSRAEPASQHSDGWPGEIYLQAGDDPLGQFSEYDEVSWCDHPQGQSDVRYVRADEASGFREGRNAQPEQPAQRTPAAPVVAEGLSASDIEALAACYEYYEDDKGPATRLRSLLVAGSPAEALGPVVGDKLPPVGSKVLIHLARQDEWIEHTVTGYYVWGDLGGNPYLHRVFVRVMDSEGYDNARLLKDVRIPGETAAAEPMPAAGSPSDEGWAEYLKEGETPLQRLKREIKDSDSLASLLAAEKRKNETSSAAEPMPASEAAKLADDLAWHKEALAAHSGKLKSVWEGIREAVEKYSGKPCEGEPFDRLDELLSSLAAPAAPTDKKG